MHYLVYVSQTDAAVSREELAGILSVARARNTVDGITGLLIYTYDDIGRRGTFLQLLEGEKERVQATFRRIAADPRHHTICVADEGDASEACFPDWSMGFRDVDPAELAGFEGFSDLGSSAFWERAGTGELADAMRLIRSFYAPA